MAKRLSRLEEALLIIIAIVESLKWDIDTQLSPQLQRLMAIRDMIEADIAVSKTWKIAKHNGEL